MWAESAPFSATTATLDRPRHLAPGRHRGPAAGPAGADDPYNLWMIDTTAEALAASLPTTISDSSALDLPDGLTVDDALRIAEAVASRLAESTRRVYGHGWRQWERWCSARQTSALPARPAMICAYLTERASEGALVPTLDLAIGAISYAHRSRGLDDPTLSEAVRQVRRGLRRIVGAAPRRQSRPLDTNDIRQILEPIDRTTAKGARDAAIILLGYASALRRSELAALDLADMESKPGGLLLHVRQSKTDQHAEGQVVAVACGQYADTDPLATLDAWLDCRGREAGPLFTSMRNKAVTDERVSGNAIARMLRNRARDAGLPAERITPHSLRAGHATTAAVAGVSLDRIAAQTRHKRLSTLLERYIRPAQALDLTSSRDLGL